MANVPRASLLLALAPMGLLFTGCPEIVVPPITGELPDTSTTPDSAGDGTNVPDSRPDTPAPDAAAETDGGGCTPSIERCDGLDNDCDGETDEGFNLGGIPIGDGCGEGACAGGTVSCDDNGTAFCTSDILAADAEVCDNSIDDDCNGLTDEGCVTVPADIDGDAFEEPADCNPYDAAYFPGAPEGCCPKDADYDCDFDCDGNVNACAENDGDGDSFETPSDCDDTNPLIFPGAAEQCGNGVDEDCSGDDLPCAGVADIDNDGYSNAVDCEPDNPNVFPGALETCDGKDNNCNGQVDEGNPGGGGACTGPLVECGEGVEVCSGGTYLCLSGPAEDEICDGKDNDCDGATDEDFNFQGTPVGAACDGVGACGLGVVECAEDGATTRCSTDPGGSADQSKPEICDPLDNDCDGENNEDISPDLLSAGCLNKGVCAGVAIPAICSPQGALTCDYTNVPGYQDAVELACDGQDNNCDGFTDEFYNIGMGCDGPDSDECANGVFVCSPTGGNAAFCDESNASTAVEICDGLDNDCDNDVDEGFDKLGTPCDGDDTDLCPNGIWTCAPDGSGEVCINESILDLAEVCGNLTDDDCDGETDEADCVPGT